MSRSRKDLTLRAPFLGCLPRPLNRPGGSTRKFPTFSLRPSRRHVVYLASISSFCFFNSFFSAVDMAFFFAFSASKCWNMGRKSQSAKLLILVPSVWKDVSDRLGATVWRNTHRRMFLEDFLPIPKKVLVELIVLGMVALDEGSIKAGHLFRLWRKRDFLACQEAQRTSS